MHFNDMVLVVQIWIWECAKTLGLQFASKISETAIPRCLRWRADDCPEHGDLKIALENPSLEVLPILVPEEDEKKMMVGCKFTDEVKESYFDNIVASALAATKSRKETSKGTEVAIIEGKRRDANVDVTTADMIKGWLEKFERKLDYVEHSLCDRMERVEKKTDALNVEVQDIKRGSNNRASKRYKTEEVSDEETEFMSDTDGEDVDVKENSEDDNNGEDSDEKENSEEVSNDEEKTDDDDQNSDEEVLIFFNKFNESISVL